MAISDEQLAQLRKMIDEEDGAGGWTDIALAALAEANLATDGSYDLRKVASTVWEAKAAAYVELVNTSESGSSRSMAQKFDHAITMAKTFGTSSTGTDTSTAAPRSTKIVRATREG